MKKFFAVLLAALLAAGIFTACGGAQDTPKENVTVAPATSGKDEATLAGQTVSLVMWGNDARKEYFDGLLAPFTEETGIQVEINLVPLEEIVTKTSAQIAAGQSYDLVWMTESMLPQFIATNNLEDMSVLLTDEAYNFSDISQTLSANYIVDGKLYAVPWTSSPRVWFYNKDLIAQAGLTDPYELAAKGEWTYEKLYEYAAAISALSDSTYGFTIWNYSSPNDWGILLDWTWSHGASLFDEAMTKCTINTPEGIAAMQAYMDCITNGLTTTPDSSVDFASGQLGFTRNTISLKGTLSDVEFSWDILPNPVGSDPEAPTAVGVAAYTIPKGSKHKEAALEVIKFLTAAEQMEEDYMMSTFTPTRISSLSSDKFLDQGCPTADHIELAIVNVMAGNTRLYPTCDYYDEADLKVKEILSAWYAGQYADTAAMAADMEAQLNEILSN